MNFEDIRRLTIIALFSDDDLLNRLVLKGGNAISIVYGLGSRTSLDLDFSLEHDFEDVEDARRRIFRALNERFSAAGYTVFDEEFERRPAALRQEQEPWWGGYQLKFKIIGTKKHQELGGDKEAIRRQAVKVSPEQRRIFSVDLSKNEYCEGKAEFELDDYTIYVYTPLMIVVEKLRAICQQMPEYTLDRYQQPRARDFYDIHLLLTATGTRLEPTEETLSLIRNIFEAKKVPLSLIAKIADHREFHRPDWPAVKATITGDLPQFDFFFDFVLGVTEVLKPLWIEHPPL